MTTNFIILGAIVLLLMIWTLSPGTKRKRTSGGSDAPPLSSDFNATSPSGGGWVASSHSGSFDFGSSCDAGGGGCDGGGGS